MHSSRHGVGKYNTNHGQEPFMEPHNTPSIFSVSYHHLPRYNWQETHITYGQPRQGFPAMFQIDGREREEEEQQVGHHRLAKQEQEQPELQSQPIAHHPPLPFVNVNFKLAMSEKSSCDTSSCHLISTEAQGLHVHQQDYYPTLSEPSWKAVVTGDLNNDNKKSNEMDKKGPALFGELEAVCNLDKTEEMNQSGTGSTVAANNSPQSLPSTAMKNRSAGSDGANRRLGSSKAVSTKKAERRRRKGKLKELTWTSMLCEALLKRVVDQQEFLHKKFLEVIERMERERMERQEAWRREETRKHENEASLRAREMELASSRDALIITYIQKITAQKPYLLKEQRPEASSKGIDK